jgi:hypothetical protein
MHETIAKQQNGDGHEQRLHSKPVNFVSTEDDDEN